MFQIPFGSKKGLSLIEILVSIAIISSTLISLLGLTSFYLKASSLANNTTRANLLAQESLEQIRNFRDGTYWESDGLGTIATNTDYYIEKSLPPQEWQLVQGTENLDIFTRKFTLEDALRDGNDNIVSSGGTEDSNTKKITITVSWQERGKNRQIGLISFLTNWRQ